VPMHTTPIPPPALPLPRASTSPWSSCPVPPLPGVYHRLPHTAPTRQYPQALETRTVHAKQLDGLRKHAEDEKDSASVSGASSVVSIRHHRHGTNLWGPPHSLLDHAPRSVWCAYMYARSRRRASSASSAHISGEEDA
jgi:hypothetical protein